MKEKLRILPKGNKSMLQDLINVTYDCCIAEMNIHICTIVCGTYDFFTKFIDCDNLLASINKEAPKCLGPCLFTLNV